MCADVTSLPVTLNAVTRYEFTTGWSSAVLPIGSGGGGFSIGLGLTAFAPEGDGVRILFLRGAHDTIAASAGYQPFGSSGALPLSWTFSASIQTVTTA